MLFAVAEMAPLILFDPAKYLRSRGRGKEDTVACVIIKRTTDDNH